MNTTELRKLLAKATPGPWMLDEWSPSDYLDGIQVDARATGPRGSVFWSDKQDARIIVAAVNALPALLDVVEAAREACESGPWVDDQCPMARLARALGGWK